MYMSILRALVSRCTGDFWLASVIMLIVLMVTGGPARAGQPPRLVLQITVDGLRGDLPQRFANVLGEGGFRYLMEKGIKLEGVKGVQYMYHDPCHSPMKTYAPNKVANELMGSDVLLSDRCCGEAGTFAISRPDIATQVRFRKQEELHKGITQLTGEAQAENGNVKMLTSCPACKQGLSRYADDTGLETDYIVVELAKGLMGKDWNQEFTSKLKHGGIEQILL